MKWKTVLLATCLFVSCIASAAAKGESTAITLNAVNDQDRPILLEGSDKFELSWNVPISREGLYTMDNQPFLRDDQGNLYIQGTEGIQSIDSKGHLIWKRPLTSHGGKVWSLLIGRDGTLYVVQGAEYVPNGKGETTAQFGYVIALNKATGDQLWEYVLNKPFFPEVPLFNTAAGDAQGNLIMETKGGLISIGSNGVNWTYSDFFPDQTGRIVNNGLTLDASGNVYALIAPPTKVVEETYSSLFCLNRQGELIWRQDEVAPFLNWMKLQFTAGGQLYGDNTHDLYQWDETTHKFVLIRNATPELMKELKLPQDHQGGHYSGNQKWDSTHNQPLWTYAKEAGYYSITLHTQSDDEGNVYFTDYGGNLISADPNGNKRFELKANDAEISDFPFFVTGDGTVYGFSLDMGVFRISEKGNPVKVYVDDARLSVPINPEIANGRTIVPLRAIFEALGANVVWNARQKSITATKNGTVISLRVGQTTAYLNGTKLELEAAPRIVGNSTLVPLRFVSEALGASVDWDSVNRVVRIHS
jgi:outer membrane protein assembly factor BamB